MAPELFPVVDHGSGNTTRVVDLGSGRALVVDATPDLRARCKPRRSAGSP